MKFFAPTANWDMKSSESWWPMLGTAPTAAGVRVSEEVALTYSAVFAATRVISETLASLPLFVLQQVNDRTTRKATGHPLYPLLHDAPTDQQDIVAWLDMQVHRQLNWGNAYAEVQRDQAGAVVALWHIHPSRIPVCNIEFNPQSGEPGWDSIVAGEPGELVYWVRNDNGTETPIPASDMLHVPGVLSRNGITGVSIPLTGAETIGIAMATERHAGSFYRNGAVSNMAIKSPKVVKKEKAEYLREQWQKTFGGVHNHYKTLLLEDGMEPVQFSISPEASQLIEARGLGTRDIARLYRVPPHMIGDLSRATWSNIESEEIAFVQHTMLPWITRWEKALYRQLLSDDEKRQYRFKFNVMGLLRGDSAARGQFYKVLFDMGAASPNDIRAFEDMNPIDGGDQYFVPGNNLVPLDKIGELAQAQIDSAKPMTDSPGDDSGTVDGATDVQATALNGAQIIALVDIANRLATDQLPPQGARAMIEAAFPAMDRELIATIIKELGAFDPEPPPGSEPPGEPAPSPDREEEKAQLRQSIVDAIATINSSRNTAEIEDLAAKRALFEAEQAESVAAVAAERESMRRLLAKAIKREIDKLADWEWKWLDKATEKPDEWSQARVEFYGRFTRFFIANLSEYQAEAEACGIVLDLEWGAQRYSVDSVRDLKSLDGHAADNYHDKLREFANVFRKSQWTERSTNLANDMVERGVRLFDERKTQKGAQCQN